MNNNYYYKYIVYKQKYQILKILQKEDVKDRINSIYELLYKKKSFVDFIEAINAKTKQFYNVYDGYPHMKEFIDNYIDDIGRIKYHILNKPLLEFINDVYVRYLLINLYFQYTKNKKIIILKKEDISKLIIRTNK